MSGILGKKIGMTRIFQDDGRVIPITVIQCEPNEITQVKTVEKDGYPAIVLGFLKLKKPSKTRKFRYLKEFRIKEEEIANYKKGDFISLESLKDIESVEISATSKGKGFQGVVKRYHFAGGPKTHGSHFNREPGSIGTRAKPGRVHKGKKLPGRMGMAKTTLKNIPVIKLDIENNIICLKGPTPGPTGTVISIKK
ncbi:50S ribosomal protein L3 [Candidatus Peregrinibacteria bacterium RIFCSPLOWO2_01_FULL_39_12]|nr:MAG: 50S ribosomal protein L3 [Candidatus Peregrinibacteria bacterium RIFCSPLOWO2_01_FULL_39_12]OGJ43396.1 MAG: 50S ribosomal protein L3 [Candidatus Peregrinibacteria bacterium RIFCSPLOWO2_02_FULL_39_10]